MTKLVDIRDFDIGSPVYCYHMLQRPPAPGALPREGLLEADDRCGYSERTGKHYWGTVIYERELTNDELEHYDMVEA